MMLIYLFLVAGISLILFGILSKRTVTVSVRKRLLEEEPQEEKTEKVAKIRNINLQNYFAWVFGLSNFLLRKLNLEDKIYTRLHAGHVKLSALEFFNIKLLFGFIFVISTLVTLGGKPLVILLIAFIFGYLMPDFWLKTKIKRYKAQIARYLPETVDLLGLCIEAGLDFTTAMHWVVNRTKPTPMIEELAFVLEEIKWGKSRTQALKDMAKRLDLAEVSSFSQILVQAERMGTPVVEVFSILSEDTRLQRFRKGERIALKAPLKMLIPLIFCILPVIAIVIGGPILIQFTQGSIFKGF